MSKVVKVKYFNKEKLATISDENLALYDKYLRSCSIKNKEVVETTYYVYHNNFKQFMVYLAEFNGNIGLHDEWLLDNAVDVMEGFIAFCQDTLQNNKKTINNKIAAVSSFYIWSMKRGYIKFHPFDNKLDRMKKADEEKIIAQYYLSEEQIKLLSARLIDSLGKGYDIQDALLWNIMLDSANRIGAIYNLSLSKLDLDNLCFTDIREKEGYRVEVSFSSDTKQLIEEWLAHRQNSLDNLSCDAFFITKYHNEYRRMSKGTLQERAKKLGWLIGLEDFRSHCIRKTVSNRLMNKGVDPTLVASFLNHKDVSTTVRYYRKPMTSSELRAKIQEQIRG